VDRKQILKSLLIFPLAICLLLGATACTKQDDGKIAEKLDAMNGRLADIGDRLGELEERLDRVDAEKLAAKGIMLTLKDRLADIEKKFAAPPEAFKAEKWLDEGSGAASQPEGAKLASKSEEIITDIKKAIKAELKKEKEAEKLEERKKQGEQTKKWIKGDYDNKMKKFPDFAQKIGLSGSMETDIRQIAEDAYAKVIQILSDAFEKTEDEVDWMDVRKKIEEIEKDAESQIEPFVTEEQGKKLKKFFDMGR